MKSRHRLIYFCSFLLFFGSCQDKPVHPFQDLSIEQFDQLRENRYVLNNKKIRFYIDSLRLIKRDTSYIDLQTNYYYAGRNPYLWITRCGIDARCDSVIKAIEKLTKIGFKKQTFHLNTLKKDLQRIRQLDFDESHNINFVMARIEYYMTKAYMRYASGQRFGFVNPRKLFNNLDNERIDSINSHYRVLYDIGTKTAGKAFVKTALQCINNDSLYEFLSQVQPTDQRYELLEQAYLKPSTTKAQQNALFANMERLRWRIPQPNSEKYVVVNLPSFELQAVDKSKDSSLRMRICCGQKRHKTPLLISKMQYVEFNPYWIVPQSIVRKEIAPRHAQNANYFERNRMKIIDKKNGEELNPEMVTASMLCSGNYRIRQEKGEGNSLGRMIFRFPNNFSIYLHDTDNKEAFKRSWRSLSHGCIRVEKPLDLAIFLFHEKNPYLIDRIRIAIDLPPYTEEGKKLINKEGYKNIGSQRFQPAIPIYITYFTAYLDTNNNRVSYYPDIYGYDSVLLEKIKRY
ncbi:MAG: L,D-transpeptidase family protein [Bacteroidaceae bacterium]